MENKTIVSEYNWVSQILDSSTTLKHLEHSINVLNLFEQKYSGTEFDPNRKLINNLIENFWIKYKAKKILITNNCK